MITSHFHSRKLKFAGYLLIMLFGLSMSAQITRYVKQGGNGDGYSWETASGNLQSIIDQADAGWNIYVGAGTYQRNTGQSFSMKSGVKIYGGFPATGNPGTADRNPALNPTILQGNGNRVLLNNNVDTAARLDGFTIQGGTLTGSENGAGMCNNNSSPKIVSCIIKNNTVDNWGGGIYCQNGYATFTNCLVYGNTASGGGGAFNLNDQTTYTNCTFTANNSNVNGGAVHLHESGSVTFSNSISWGNNAAAEGDEFYTTGSSTVVLYSSISANETGDIFGNMTPAGSTSYDNPMFTNAASNNFAPVYGSPAINTGNNSSISGYITDLAGNTRIYSGTVDKGAYELQAVIRYVRENAGGNGLSWENASGNLQAMINASSAGDEVWVAGGLYQPAQYQSFSMKEGVKIYGGFPISGNPAMADRNIAYYITTLYANGSRVMYNNANGLTNASVLDGFSIMGGSTSEYGGGMKNVDVSPFVANCIFTENSANSGGAICNSGYNLTPVFKNCLIYGNTANTAGGTYDAGGADPQYINTTIARNAATSGDGGGMITGPGSVVTIQNSIIWGNTATNSGYQAGFATAPVFSYSIINNSPLNIAYSTLSATNSSFSDPMFVNAAGSNFRLKGGSPARNTGNTSFFSDAAISKDLDGNARVIESVIDMGPYEKTAPVYGNTLYVRQGATGDGTSWDDASGSISAMVSAATSGKEIWVAAGTHTPASGQSFSMKQGVKIYGGFPATGNPGIAQRNYKTNVTILYGNSSRVIDNNNNGLTNTAVLDGFTIRNGNVIAGGGNGGGMRNVNSYPLVANCIFFFDLASNGGGVYNEGPGTSRFVNCLFYSCQAGNGGAAFDTSHAATIYSSCTFVKNYASGNGGAIRTNNHGTAYLYSSIVWGNSTSGTGMQLYSTTQNAPSDGRIIADHSDVAAGTNDIFGSYTGVDGANLISSDPLFTNFDANDFTLSAGSPAIDSGTLVYTGTNIKDLAANPRVSGYYVDMGVYEVQNTTPLIRYVKQGGTGNGTSWAQASGDLNSMITSSLAGETVWIAQGTYGVGNGIVISKDVNIYGGFPATGNPVMADRNSATYETVINGSGGLTLAFSYTQNALLDGITITGGGGSYGGAISNNSASPRINNCIFRNNTTTVAGGAICNVNSSPIITNTLFTGNTSVKGGAIASLGTCSPQLINVTFSNNNATQFGGAVYTDFGTNTALKNCIVWGNTAVNGGQQLYAENTAIAVQYSILLTGTENVGSYFSGQNNISSNPLFTGASNYTLAPCSPAVNAGSTALLTGAATAKDLAGNARTFGTIDIGAYELQAAAEVAAPTATTPQQYMAGATVANLVATGTALQWYTVQQNGTALDPATVLVSGTYYVSQTVSGCESARTSVVVQLQSATMPIRYVRTVASGNGNGSSWANASGDMQAMITTASPGDQVWVAEGTYQRSTGQSFTLRSGVKVYGGFPTTGDPVISDRNFTENETILQGNNAGVVMGSGLSSATVFDGFTVTGGNRESGGGIYLTSSAVKLENLIVRNNTATNGAGITLNSCSAPSLRNITITGNSCSGWGAGIYFSATNGGDQLENIIITNNTTGDVGAGIFINGGTGAITMKNLLVAGNSAGTAPGIFAMYSEASVRITNSTIAGNMGPIEAMYLMDTPNYIVENSIIQGEVYTWPQQLTFTNSLVAGSGGSNAWVSNQVDGGGNIDADPLFTDPASGDYSLQAGSPAINTGNTALFADADTATDLAGNPRFFGSTIDMGAYESQIEVITGIRYVKTAASGDGSGTSWANASDDIQAMIAILQEGEVWVAAGTYQPSQGQSFSLKEGIKVYGGFPATGDPLMADRNFTTNETMLQGNGVGVVTGTGLSSATIFDGFTITGGQREMGGGIYIELSSVRLGNLIVRNNTAVDGGGICLAYSSSTLLRNIKVTGNSCADWGAGIYFYSSLGGEQLENITVTDNISGYAGGGIAMNGSSNVTIKNLLVAGNNASVGAGIFGVYSSARIINATIAGNTGTSVALHFYQGGFTVENSIIDGEITGGGQQPTFTNSLVAGSGGSGAWALEQAIDGGGNIDADPMFTNTADGEYSLQGGSPAVNAGNTDLFANAAVSTDLAGNERLDGISIDMGAYEYKPIACSIVTVWDGDVWSNGTPVSYEYSATINGNFNSDGDGNITACSLTVNSGNTVIAAGDNFTIKGVVMVDNDNATFTIQHNANLIQIDDVNNTGTISVIKESAPMYRLDYALWASPVAGQKLKAFSSQTLDNRFYSYNPISDAFATIQTPATTDFSEGKSYLIRVANNQPAFVSDDIAPTPWEGTFIGVPNNGNVDVPIMGMTDEIDGYNGVGNPYPSSINIKAFFDANQNNLAEDTPIYFWRKKNEAGTSSYASLTLAGYNQNSGNAFGDSSNGVFDDPNNSENWVINPGQGFIVQVTANNVTFNNQMRVAVNNGQMFRTAQDQDAPDKSRLWLNLTNADGAFGQATIAYTPFTTLGRDFGWDGKALTDGDIAIYSLAGDGKFGIQARPSFDPADEVPMELKVTLAGSYTISLDHFDGVFAEGQEIYVRDNFLGVTHNLENPYQLTTEAGIITGRFDVVYAEALATDVPVFNSNSIIVYKHDSAINISTGNVDMKSVSVYDIRGRQLYNSNDINTGATSITDLQAQEQMLIVEVTTKGGIKTTRKIIF